MSNADLVHLHRRVSTIELTGCIFRAGLLGVGFLFLFLILLNLPAASAANLPPAPKEKAQTVSVGEATGLVNKITVAPEKFAGVYSVDVDRLIKEKASLGYVGSSDDEFKLALIRCLMTESASRKAMFFEKQQCLAGCEDFTDRVSDLLKNAKNQSLEPAVWNACASCSLYSALDSTPETKTALAEIAQFDGKLESKVAESNRVFDQAKANGASSADLAALQKRLQGEIDSLTNQRNERGRFWQLFIEEKISYAASMFASTNKLNYLMSRELAGTRGFDVTEPMCRYISGLKGKAGSALEGPNPYKIGVVGVTKIDSFEQDALELACEAVRKQKQLRAIVRYSALPAGGTDVSSEVLKHLNSK